MSGASYRSTPSFAVGGVAWLDQNGEPGDATTRPPEGGWRCFHCNEHFNNWRAAMRHFGNPSDVVPRKSWPMVACLQPTYDDMQRERAIAAIGDAGWKTIGSISARGQVVDLVAHALGARRK